MRTVDREHQQALIRQMERHTHDQAYFLFLYNPIQLYAVNKAVEFVPYVSTNLNLAETSVTDQHWSVRQATMKTRIGVASGIRRSYTWVRSAEWFLAKPQHPDQDAGDHPAADRHAYADPRRGGLRHARAGRRPRRARVISSNGRTISVPSPRTRPFATISTIGPTASGKRPRSTGCELEHSLRRFADRSNSIEPIYPQIRYVDPHGEEVAKVVKSQISSDRGRVAEAPFFAAVQATSRPASPTCRQSGPR